MSESRSLSYQLLMRLPEYEITGNDYADDVI